ncbi:uncharacterized protein UHOD_11204 [Ustilago sp. UG-2017b]|nr:uncharacterized protein UHOD_11204 [Ustilago sp. UG-2017b]
MQGGPSTTTRRTELKEHTDGYHSGARETRVKGTVTGRRRRGSGRSTGTKARKKATIAGLGMVEQEARGLAGTGSRHGRSATSMETMDMEDRAVCMVVQAPPQGDRAQGAYRWFPLRGSRNKSQRNRHRSKGRSSV